MIRLLSIISLWLMFMPFCLSAQSAQSTQSFVVTDRSDNEITVEVMPADGELMVIWLVDHTEERRLFETMLDAVNRAGVEVWRVDLLADYFIARSSENIRTLSGEGVAALIEEAHRRSAKRIVLAAYDRLPLPLLRGVRQWQQSGAEAQSQSESPLDSRPESRLAGAMLFYPNLFGPPPIAGEDPEVDAIVAATNIPITIYQPERGTHRLRLPEVVEEFWRGGSSTFVYFVPDVRDWFFMNPLEDDSSDYRLATTAERQATAKVPQQLLQFAQIMDGLPKPLLAVSVSAERQQEKRVTGLVKVNDSKVMPPFKLADMQGRQSSFGDFRGRITLVNFWATWCPPCVEEVPSLNRLAERYSGQPFAVVSIDFRESTETVAEFMQKVAVDFPVLLDGDGKASMSWKVFSLPSSFIVDGQGRLRYSANRAIDWDSPEVWRVVDELLQEQM